MDIKTVEISSKNAIDLCSLLNKEWPDVGEFEAVKYGVKIPNPIAAYQDNELVGGLSFTAYKIPDAENIVVWVNAVFVLPVYRGHGIASNLIRASHNYSNCLFALTDIPDLYIKAGWKIVKVDSNGTIVNYVKNT